MGKAFAYGSYIGGNVEGVDIGIGKCISSDGLECVRQFDLAYASLVESRSADFGKAVGQVNLGEGRLIEGIAIYLGESGGQFYFGNLGVLEGEVAYCSQTFGQFDGRECTATESRDLDCSNAAGQHYLVDPGVGKGLRLNSRHGCRNLQHVGKDGLGVGFALRNKGEVLDVLQVLGQLRNPAPGVGKGVAFNARHGVAVNLRRQVNVAAKRIGHRALGISLVLGYERAGLVCFTQHLVADRDIAPITGGYTGRLHCLRHRLAACRQQGSNHKE